MMAEANVVGDRNEFMHHAYNALYTGSIRGMPEPIVELMVARVMEDVCGVVRAMDKQKREEFINSVTQQVRTS